MMYVAMGPPDKPATDTKPVIAMPVFVLSIQNELDGWVAINAILYAGNYRQVYRFELLRHKKVVRLVKAEAVAAAAKSGSAPHRMPFTLTGKMAGFDVNPGLDGQKPDGTNWLETVVVIDAELEAMDSP